MQKTQIISLTLIGFITIYFFLALRILFLSPGVEQGSVVRINFTLLNKPDLSRYNQIINYYNYRIVIKASEVVEIGGNYEVIGSVSERVTGVIFPKYTLIYPSISLYEEKVSFFEFIEFYPKYILPPIDKFREFLLHKLVIWFPEPHAGLLAGIMLGLKSKLSKQFYDQLIASGTIHVVAASGFNLSVVSGMLMRLGEKKLNKVLRTLIYLVGIWFYAILAGFEPPIVRAGVMVSVAYGASIWGRDYLPSWALLCSSFVMLVLNPLLIENVSFWLSITSTWGILWLSSGFANYLGNSIKSQISNINIDSGWVAGFISNLSITLAAQITTLPIIALVFERVSLTALLANLGILWLIPPIMALGGVLLLSSLVFPTLSSLAAMVVWLPLSLVVWQVEIFGSSKWTSIEVGIPGGGSLNSVSAIYILGYYVLLISLVSWVKKRRRVVQ